jgi:hypothetical protein
MSAAIAARGFDNSRFLTDLHLLLNSAISTRSKGAIIFFRNFCQPAATACFCLTAVGTFTFFLSQAQPCSRRLFSWVLPQDDRRFGPYSLCVKPKPMASVNGKPTDDSRSQKARQLELGYCIETAQNKNKMKMYYFN